MAIIFKISPNMEAAMASFDKIGDKSSKTFNKMTKDADKSTKSLEKSNKNMMIAGAAIIGFFWGVAQVSGVLHTYLGIFNTVLGSIFDTLFISLYPLFKILLDKLLDFGQWLRDSPQWVRDFGGALLIILPAIWAFNFAMSSNPIGAVIIAVALLATGLYLLWQNWGDVNNALDGAKEKHGWIVPILMAIKFYLDMWILQWKITYEAIKFYIEAVIWYLDILWASMEAIILLLKGDFAGAKNLLKPFADAFNDAIISIGLGIQKWIMDMFIQMPGWIQDALINIGEKIYDFIAGAVEWGYDLMVNFAEGIWNGAVNVWDAAAGIFDGIGDYLSFDIRANDAMAKRWGADLAKHFSAGLSGGIPGIEAAIPDSYTSGNSGLSGGSGGGK